ncbi:MAG: periplasmic heavy metal sensor [Pseudomonadales bacterium]
MSPSASRVTIIVLVCSLAINLLFAGVIIGKVLRDHPHVGPMPSNLGWIVRYLNEDTRQALRPDLEAHRQQTLPLLRDMRRAQQEFETALVDPDMNQQELATTLEETLSELRTTSTAFQAAMHEQMIRVVVQLDAEQRQNVAQYLHRHHPRRPSGERMDRHREPSRR